MFFIFNNIEWIERIEWFDENDWILSFLWISWAMHLV
jgi:hypothetical protein